jgi:nucleoside-specific outer membrane channel protein Tsx
MVQGTLGLPDRSSNENIYCVIWVKNLKTMYPYHNKIKQRIQNDELVKYEYVDKYKQIQPALLLYFRTEPYIRPIREHRFEEYEKLFEELSLKD